MQTAEFNHEDFGNQSEADKSLMVKFYYKDVQNKLKSKAEGRPIFTEKTYIEIRVAGQRDVQAARPATHADKQRFPRHFEAFEKRVEPPTEGMPLAEWPKITRTQAEELAFLNVKTVEQLAGMKDSNLQQFMNGYKLRDGAVKWLEQNSVETDDREKEELRSTVATLQAQVAELLADKGKGMPDTGTAGNEPAAYVAPADSPISTLDTEDTPPPTTDGAAVEVPAAPGAVKAAPKKRRAKK